MKKLKFKKTAMCELCGEKPAEYFASYYDAESFDRDVWLFVCDYERSRYYDDHKAVFAKPEAWKTAKEIEEYAERPLMLRQAILIDEFLSSGFSTVDWIAQLSTSDWVDTRSFFYMMHRFRAAAECYHAFGTPPEYQ